MEESEFEPVLFGSQALDLEAVVYKCSLPKLLPLVERGHYCCVCILGGVPALARNQLLDMSVEQGMGHQLVMDPHRPSPLRGTLTLSAGV